MNLAIGRVALYSLRRDMGTSHVSPNANPSQNKCQTNLLIRPLRYNRKTMIGVTAPMEKSIQ